MFFTVTWLQGRSGLGRLGLNGSKGRDVPGTHDITQGPYVKGIWVYLDVQGTQNPGLTVLLTRSCVI